MFDAILPKQLIIVHLGGSPGSLGIEIISCVRRTGFVFHFPVCDFFTSCGIDTGSIGGTSGLLFVGLPKDAGRVGCFETAAGSFQPHSSWPKV